MEEYIAKASLVNAAQFNWLPLNKPLAKAIGWLILKAFPSFLCSCSWVSTQAQAYLLASVNSV